MYRKVEVPFIADGKKVKIPVYLVDSEEHVGEVCLDVFVPIWFIKREVIDSEIYEYYRDDVPPGLKPDIDMRDWSGHCRGQGKCVTWRDLSVVAWSLRRKDGGKNKLGLQLVFFAQCVMRGFLHKLVQIEGNIQDQLDAGETIFWKPYVDCLRREIESYKHVDQDDSGLPDFVRDEVVAMWRRVKRKVSGNNKETLKNALSRRGGKIIDLNL
jgi:hypothetical protein